MQKIDEDSNGAQAKEPQLGKLALVSEHRMSVTDHEAEFSRFNRELAEARRARDILINKARR
jgi:hypothetical protein